ncbi:hypothetical protein SSX86_005633 [Deinandra increscens subsp. villosa]|uniref:Uncharacterized protein n=1 Tax=Deinandra increscens subsp. villosa TaxID=3103831 RepID=A0AAP0HA16_9ASTR
MGSWSSTVKVIHSGDGRLQEFRQPIRACHVLSGHPAAFLCSSDTMFVGCHVPQLPGNEELQMGQIYFVMPLSKSNNRLSLQELCSLAIKAGSALQSKA